MTTLTFLIILAIIFIILIVLFKIANTVLKILLGVVVVALIFLLITQANDLYLNWVDSPEPPIQPLLNETTENLTKERCEELGGIYGPQGLAGNVFCNLPTSDANKACEDSADCEGLCILNETTQEGFCQPTKAYFGCFTTLQGGEPGPALCID